MLRSFVINLYGIAGVGRKQPMTGNLNWKTFGR